VTRARAPELLLLLSLAVSVACRSREPAVSRAGVAETPSPSPIGDAAPPSAPLPVVAAAIDAGPAIDAGAGDDLVDLATVAPSVIIDIRYATADNFTHHAVYPLARCVLRRAVAERLARVAARLAGDHLGLKVWDCYRPFSVQEAMWRLVPDGRYVARPVRKRGVPVAGSKHNRGAAVDLTLVDAAGSELEMPTAYDDFSARAHRDDASATATARRNAATLEAAMSAEGFEPLATEWWHFDAHGWQRFALEDQPLDVVAP
jgi:D-alanyl-D-alanine dipeptidase